MPYTGAILSSLQQQAAADGNPALDDYAAPAPGTAQVFGAAEGVTVTGFGGYSGVMGVTGLVGTALPFFQPQLYNRTHIFASKEWNAGLIVTELSRDFEFWSAFPEARVLQSITPSGATDGVTYEVVARNTSEGALAIADTPPPTTYQPNESRTYRFTIAKDGAALVDGTFAFAINASAGYGSEALYILIDGSRMIVLSLPIDWADGFLEGLGYLTNVLPGYSDSEQRRILRSIPRPSARYTIKTLTARETQLLLTTLWAGQPKEIGIPWWREVSLPTAAIAPGATVIAVDTTHRPSIAAGALLMLWKDAFRWEAIEVLSKTDTSVTLKNEVQGAYAVSDLVVPLKSGRMTGAEPLGEISRDYAALATEFTCEGVLTPATPPGATTAYGFDVLDTFPNQRDDIEAPHRRSLAVLDAETGVREYDARSAAPVLERPMLWFLDGRSSITAFLHFLTARKGRAVPFWMLGWRSDLTLTTDVASGAPSVTVVACNYTRYMFAHPSRRYLAFLIDYGNTRVYRKVTAAVDNGDGTETLTLDTSLGVNASAANTVVSFMRLSRLADDQQRILFHNPTLAEVQMGTVEVPAEVA